MLNNGDIVLREITPEEAGLPRATLTQLKGGTPEQNARAIVQLLNGDRDEGLKANDESIVRHLRERAGWLLGNRGTSTCG